MIDGVISAKFFEASCQLLLDTGVTARGGVADLVFEDFSVEQPAASLTWNPGGGSGMVSATPDRSPFPVLEDKSQQTLFTQGGAADSFDLFTIGAVRLAAKLSRAQVGKPSWAVAQDVCARGLAEDSVLHSLVSTCSAMENGYINIRLGEPGLRQWLIFCVAGAIGLEPSHSELGASPSGLPERHHSRHRSRRNPAPDPDSSKPPASARTDQKLQLIRLCAERASQWIKVAKTNRFDVEEGQELTPLIHDDDETLFLRNVLQELMPTKETASGQGQTESLQRQRSLIISTGLLASDLLLKRTELSAPPRLRRAFGHASKLTNLWNQFFQNSALISESEFATRLRLALLLCAARYLGYIAELVPQARS